MKAYDDEDELTTYVWNHYGRLFTPVEAKAGWAVHADAKARLGSPQVAEFIYSHGNWRIPRRHNGFSRFNCYGLWDFKLDHPSCSEYGATMGREVKLLLDTDVCCFCEEGKVSLIRPVCDKRGQQIDLGIVAWG